MKDEKGEVRGRGSAGFEGWDEREECPEDVEVGKRRDEPDEGDGGPARRDDERRGSVLLLPARQWVISRLWRYRGTWQQWGVVQYPPTALAWSRRASRPSFDAGQDPPTKQLTRRGWRSGRPHAEVSDGLLWAATRWASKSASETGQSTSEMTRRRTEKESEKLAGRTVMSRGPAFEEGAVGN